MNRIDELLAALKYRQLSFIISKMESDKAKAVYDHCLSVQKKDEQRIVEITEEIEKINRGEING